MRLIRSAVIVAVLAILVTDSLAGKSDSSGSREKKQSRRSSAASGGRSGKSGKKAGSGSDESAAPVSSFNPKPRSLSDATKEPCIDKLSACPMYSTRGVCKFETVAKSCPKSCGRCQTEQTIDEKLERKAEASGSNDRDQESRKSSEKDKSNDKDFGLRKFPSLNLKDSKKAKSSQEDKNSDEKSAEKRSSDQRENDSGQKKLQDGLKKIVSKPFDWFKSRFGNQNQDTKDSKELTNSKTRSLDVDGENISGESGERKTDKDTEDNDIKGKSKPRSLEADGDNGSREKLGGPVSSERKAKGLKSSEKQLEPKNENERGSGENQLLEGLKKTASKPFDWFRRRFGNQNQDTEDSKELTKFKPRSLDIDGEKLSGEQRGTIESGERKTNKGTEDQGVKSNPRSLEDDGDKGSRERLSRPGSGEKKTKELNTKSRSSEKQQEPENEKEKNSGKSQLLEGLKKTVSKPFDWFKSRFGDRNVDARDSKELTKSKTRSGEADENRNSREKLGRLASGERKSNEGTGDRDVKTKYTPRSMEADGKRGSVERLDSLLSGERQAKELKSNEKQPKIENENEKGSGKSQLLEGLKKTASKPLDWFKSRFGDRNRDAGDSKELTKSKTRSGEADEKRNSREKLGRLASGERKTKERQSTDDEGFSLRGGDSKQRSSSETDEIRKERVSGENKILGGLKETISKPFNWIRNRFGDRNQENKDNNEQEDLSDNLQRSKSFENEGLKSSSGEQDRPGSVEKNTPGGTDDKGLDKRKFPSFNFREKLKSKAEPGSVEPKTKTEENSLDESSRQRSSGERARKEKERSGEEGETGRSNLLDGLRETISKPFDWIRNRFGNRNKDNVGNRDATEEANAKEEPTEIEESPVKAQEIIPAGAHDVRSVVTYDDKPVEVQGVKAVDVQDVNQVRVQDVNPVGVQDVNSVGVQEIKQVDFQEVDPVKENVEPIVPDTKMMPVVVENESKPVAEVPPLEEPNPIQPRAGTESLKPLEENPTAGKISDIVDNDEEYFKQEEFIFPEPKPQPLGMESGVIPDDHIKASSHDISHDPAKSRPGSRTAWRPSAAGTQNSYLQVDLGEVIPVHGIGTLGDPASNHYTSRYTVSVSKDAVNFTPLLDTADNATARVFSGNSDGSSWAHHCLHRYYGNPVDARYISFHPVDWSGSPSLQVEAFGYRRYNDALLVKALEKDAWTKNVTGCMCYNDNTRYDCACCQPSACQCPENNRHQCVQCGYGSKCGVPDVKPRSVQMDAWTKTGTGCRCHWDQSRTDCACCQNNGCQCDQRNKNQCVSCGHPEECGGKEDVFGPNSYCVPKTCTRNQVTIGP